MATALDFRKTQCMSCCLSHGRVVIEHADLHLIDDLSSCSLKPVRLISSIWLTIPDWKLN